MATDSRRRALEKEFRSSTAHLPATERARLLKEWRAERDEADRKAAEESTQEPAMTVGAVYDEADDGDYIPLGQLVYVPCPIPGYRRLRVGYNIKAQWRYVYGVDIPDGDGFGIVRRMMLIAPDIQGWAFKDRVTKEPLPKPDPADIDTYKVMVREAIDLGKWIVGEGYKEALNISLGPNS